MNYWSLSRPKRKLDGVPGVLAVYAGISLDQEWSGQTKRQLSYEEALERAGLKRIGIRRDQSGSGARTYDALLRSLGLIFYQKSTGNIKLTLAGEAIMDGRSPVSILKDQILKYQFPSSYSLGQHVNVNHRFKIHPFRFLLRLLMDDRIQYLTKQEIGRIVIVEAENETEECYEHVVSRIQQYRSEGIKCLPSDFFDRYPSRTYIKTHKPNPVNPYGYLDDIADTAMDWLEYARLAVPDDDKHLVVPPEARSETEAFLGTKSFFIDRPEDHEFFQRKYGVDPWHQKDTRNLEKTKTITNGILAEQMVKQSYVNISLKRPVAKIDSELIYDISEETGILDDIVQETLFKYFPHGSIGSFMASYFEMAFSGRDEAVDFEKATTDIFKDVFGYKAIHLGQKGSRSVPDILLLSDSEGYQSIIDNKAYAEYSISTDHHNRMVQNYIKNISSYSESAYPIGFFSYISGGFCKTINKQIRSISYDAHVPGSGIAVSDFIKMVENQQEGIRNYSHADLRKIFSINRQVIPSDYQ